MAHRRRGRSPKRSFCNRQESRPRDMSCRCVAKQVSRCREASVAKQVSRSNCGEASVEATLTKCPKQVLRSKCREATCREARRHLSRRQKKTKQPKPRNKCFQPKDKRTCVSIAAKNNHVLAANGLFLAFVGCVSLGSHTYDLLPHASVVSVVFRLNERPINATVTTRSAVTCAVWCCRKEETS